MWKNLLIISLNIVHYSKFYLEDSDEGDNFEYSNPEYTNSEYSQFDPDYPRDQPIEDRMNQIDMPNGKNNLKMC